MNRYPMQSNAQRDLWRAYAAARAANNQAAMAAALAALSAMWSRYR